MALFEIVHTQHTTEIHTQAAKTKDVMAVLLAGFSGTNEQIAKRCTPPMLITSCYRTLQELVFVGVVKEDCKVRPKHYSLLPHKSYQVTTYTTEFGKKPVTKYTIFKS